MMHKNVPLVVDATLVFRRGFAKSEYAANLVVQS